MVRNGDWVHVQIDLNGRINTFTGTVHSTRDHYWHGRHFRSFMIGSVFLPIPICTFLEIVYGLTVEPDFLPAAPALHGIVAKIPVESARKRRKIKPHDSLAGWLIIHPDGTIEMDHFKTRQFSSRGVRVSRDVWRTLYRPNCTLVRGTLTWKTP
jgi:hypothetical protein